MAKRNKISAKLGMLRALDRQRTMRNLRNAGPSLQKSKATGSGPFFRNPGRLVPDKKKKK